MAGRKPLEYTDSSGRRWVSIREMSRLAAVSQSAIRGYEKLGLFNSYKITVIRIDNHRYFDPRQSFRLAQIKAERLSNRNASLAAFAKD